MLKYANVYSFSGKLWIRAKWSSTAVNRAESVAVTLRSVVPVRHKEETVGMIQLFEERLSKLIRNLDQKISL